MPAPVGSQLSVLIHAIIAWLEAYFHPTPLPVTAEQTAVVGSWLSVAINAIESMLATYLGSDGFTKERLTIEIEGIDWITNSVIPGMTSIPPVILALLTSGLASIRANLAAQLALIP